MDIHNKLSILYICKIWYTFIIVGKICLLFTDEETFDMRKFIRVATLIFGLLGAVAYASFWVIRLVLLLVGIPV